MLTADVQSTIVFSLLPTAQRDNKSSPVHKKLLHRENSPNCALRRRVFFPSERLVLSRSVKVTQMITVV